LSENEVADMTLDSIGEAVLRADLQGNVTYLNRIAEKMTGWSREEAQGRPVGDVLRLIDGGSRAPVSRALRHATEEDKGARSMAGCATCILVRRDGYEFAIESATTLVR